MALLFMSLGLRWIAAGFVLILTGFLLPFLMVLQALEPGFVLSFFAYFASVVGVLLTFYGAFHVGRYRDNDSVRNG
jgi:hypothetical protein